MKRKSWLIALIAVMLLSLLSACGGGGSNGGKNSPGPAQQQASGGNSSGSDEKTDGQSAASEEPIEIEMAIWGNEAQLALYDELAAAYKALHPNVTVKTSVIPWADYQQKLAIMAASKTAPDIVWLAERMIPQFLTTGQLLDISSIKDDAEYEFSDIIPSSLSAFEQDGKLYGIPFSTPPQVVFYNKTLFEQNGLKTPMELYQEGNWTYEELAKAAEAIAKPNDGVFGVKILASSSAWAEKMIALLWANGGDIFNGDMTAFAMNTPEAAKTINYVKDLLDKRAHPSIGEQLTFDTGKLGMDFDNVTKVSSYRDKVDFEWDIAPLPKGDQGVVTPLGFAGYAIFKDTKHPEAALDYLKFISNKENAAKVASFFVPQRSSVLYSDEYLNGFPFPSADTMKVAAFDRIQEGRVRPSLPNWVQIDEKVTIQLDAIFMGAKSTEEALKSMEEDINALLK
jgi:ABC-type sugar transport system, periplasmic component